MSSSTSLAAGFIRRQPQAAASVVAAQARDTASAFVESLSVRDAAELFSAMNPRSAASVVVALDSARAVTILDHMAFAQAASLLRQVGPRDRKGLLAGVSRRRRRDFEATLAFAPDTVGARMTLSLDALSGSDRVADALRVKRDSDASHPDLVFVVDDQRILIGVIKPLLLLKEAEETRLADIADRNCTSVSPHLKLSFVAGLDAWQDAQELPVVSRRRELLGSISRRQLTTAADGVAVSSQSPLLAVNLFETLCHSTLDLLEGMAPGDASGSEGGADSGR